MILQKGHLMAHHLPSEPELAYISLTVAVQKMCAYYCLTQ